MSEETFENAVRRECAALAELIILKRKDYGTANLLNTPFGHRTIITVRLYEKVARLANLLKQNKEPQNESFEANVQDVAGYSVVEMMIEKGTFSLPLEDELKA